MTGLKRGHEMKKYLAGLAVLMLLVASSPAVADSIVFVPSATTVAAGEFVDVSVLLVGSDPIFMTAWSEYINFDPLVFDFVDGSVAQGSVSGHWYPDGGNTTPGLLIVGAFDFDFGQLITPGEHGITLFTFRMQALRDATGSSLSWGAAEGCPGTGFCYGNSMFEDRLVLPSNDYTFGSVPDAGSTLLLLGMGVAGLMAGLRKWRQ
jgi:hypothetical protein